MAEVGDVQSGTSTSQVTLAAPGQGRRWYLKDISVKSNQNCVLTVQSPASTNILRHTLDAGMGFEKSWADPGRPGAENQALIIDVSAGSYDINYTAVCR